MHLNSLGHNYYYYCYRVSLSKLSKLQQGEWQFFFSLYIAIITSRVICSIINIISFSLGKGRSMGLAASIIAMTET
jgi:hypothetical protein